MIRFDAIAFLSVRDKSESEIDSPSRYFSMSSSSISTAASISASFALSASPAMSAGISPSVNLPLPSGLYVYALPLRTSTTPVNFSADPIGSITGSAFCEN